ncbi:ABC transporter, ATP-binding & transmembrane domain [Galdieria sulphuraria]|uniref:ABC transporter, ATP-binding & transmembrane domain n=1 Tax=Galdieria sulphuraria TaxID=130081 RepID=M2X5Z6_GALSU|nr:ABC transporter, ATP-binding & transmembrane domain [Galdieria sulphuraria]EME31900.1 ABC transporter, ATP-binding & transmembrane domain [Galdieria sulphuraria]|eukprot:XP_005708420.1 ABC transporter, ATP-binding & transmembrane domain [Galdieria sulphuraria]
MFGFHSIFQGDNETSLQTNLTKTQPEKPVDSDTQHLPDLDSNDTVQEVQSLEDKFISTLFFGMSLGTFSTRYRLTKLHWIKYFLGDGRYLLGGVVLSIVYGMLLPVFALLIGRILNYYFELADGTRLSNASYEDSILIPFFLLGGVAWFLNFGQNCMWYRLGMKQTYLVRKRALYILMDMPTHRKEFALSMLREKHLTEEDSPAFRMMEDFGNFFYYGSEMVCALVIAFVGSWQLTLLLCGSGLLLVGTGIFEIKMLEQSLQRTRTQTEVESHEKRILDSLPLIHECNTEREEYQVYCQLLDDFFLENLKRRRLYIASASVSVLLVTEIYIIGIWFSAWLAEQKMISKGDIVSVLLAIGLAAVAIVRSVRLFQSVRDSRFHVEEFFSTFRRDNSENSWFKSHALVISKRRLHGELEVQNLRFPNENWQRSKGMSFYVRRGEIVALVSRDLEEVHKIIAMIQRNIPSECGLITIDGVDITRFNGTSFRSIVGNVCNAKTLLEGTIVENLQYGMRDVNFSDIVTAAQQSYIHKFIQSLPRGYQTMIGTPDSPHFPEWAYHRLALCRVLVRQPIVLLLDAKTVEAYIYHDDIPVDALKQIAKDRTCVFVSNSALVVQAATRICVFKHGEIITQGKHYDLFENCLYYRDVITEESEPFNNRLSVQTSSQNNKSSEPQASLLHFPSSLSRSSSGALEMDDMNNGMV